MFFSYNMWLGFRNEKEIFLINPLGKHITAKYLFYFYNFLVYISHYMPGSFACLLATIHIFWNTDL